MSTSPSPLTSPVAKARGLGSAKEGVSHWWWQRVTAVLLVPLLIWFVCSFLDVMVGASRSAVAEWFAAPFNAIALIVLLATLFYHAKLGLQVVIEDYIHKPCMKIFKLFALNIATFVLVTVSAVAIIKLHIMGI